MSEDHLRVVKRLLDYLRDSPEPRITLRRDEAQSLVEILQAFGLATETDDG